MANYEGVFLLFAARGTQLVIIQIWIFKFAGSSHANYVNYLLEVYCMLRYEASLDLRNAILNNWLVNIKGELGHWMPVDQHQEHYNLWLQQMRKKHGGEFKVGYALLGDVDLVLIVDLPDIGQAMKTSAALAKLLGASFSTAPAVSVEEFDKLMS